MTGTEQLHALLGGWAAWCLWIGAGLIQALAIAGFAAWLTGPEGPFRKKEANDVESG